MNKLTRKQIAEGLKQTPIENILVGHQNANKINLTKKQKDFARKVASGLPKAQAYRESYNSKGKPTTEAVEGHKLASNPKISHMIDAFTLANEAREYLIPAQIRTMAIQNLVTIAIDEGEKTSNKLKALELIGKMSEVSLFSETKTHVHLHSSADIKTKLMEGLRLAFSNSRALNDQAKVKAESLLTELDNARTIDIDEIDINKAEATPLSIPKSSDPTIPRPPKSGFTPSHSLHSIPDTRSHSKTESQLKAASLLEDLTITAVIVTNPLESNTCVSIGSYPDSLNDDSEGVGVEEKPAEVKDVSRETPPVTNWAEKG
jgi:hypothetical protein